MKYERSSKCTFLFGVGVALMILFAFGLFVYQSPTQVIDESVSEKDVVIEQIKGVLAQQVLPVFAQSPDESPKEMDMVVFDIEAAPVVVSLIDGTTTTVWSYNGTVPGPELRVDLGDTIQIRFTNNLPQETTIHFHGIRVPNDMDGVPGVTQEPIEPGDTFVYEFTPSDAGTYWYHPHVRSAEQVERGLYGTIVVIDPEDGELKQDMVMVLDDWRLTEDAEVYPKFVTGHDISHDGRWGNVVTVNGSRSEVVQAAPGETMRLRFVNTANARIFSLDFGELDTEAIAFDGIASRDEFDPEPVELSPGNRMDVLLTVPKDTKVDEVFTVYDTFTRQAIPLFRIEVVDTLVDDLLVDTGNVRMNASIPSWEDAMSLTPDVIYRLNAERGGPYGISWTINGSAFPDGETVTLENGKFHKLRFVNESARLHPMHLHGQFFKVLARDGVPVDEPFMRDTVLLYGRETVDVGIVPLDSGTWASHCHILEHAEAGMMSLFEVT